MLASGGWDLIQRLKGLTVILLTWTVWRAPTNASKWRMGFNSAFKGLNTPQSKSCVCVIILWDISLFGYTHGPLTARESILWLYLNASTLDPTRVMNMDRQFYHSY